MLPYCQALYHFVAHVQQLDMESNGKRVMMGAEADGEAVDLPTGAIYFGEPGTNGQHSLFLGSPIWAAQGGLCLSKNTLPESC